MSEANFSDGKGPKGKDTPDEFPSDWHYQAHLDALERDLAGLLHRKRELEDMNAHPDQVKAADEAVKHARENLKRYGVGQKAAAKRPRATRKKETR